MPHDPRVRGTTPSDAGDRSECQADFFTPSSWIGFFQLPWNACNSPRLILVDDK